jgi:hypothetical protein
MRIRAKKLEWRIFQQLTFDLNVWAANNLAPGGASRDERRTLQVAHASG